MAGDTGMAGKVALLLWGAQTTQLLVEPPWRPAVLWDPVTLTCQGLGTASATTWYKDEQRWGQKGGVHFTVTKSGTYWCDRPDTGLSSPVTVSNELVVLQVPARALLEGDTVTLRCRNRENKQLTNVYFYREEKYLKGPQDGTELSLSPLQLGHSGRYRCKAWVLSQWSKSELVTVTVHSASPVCVPTVPVANATITLSPPSHQVHPGDPVTLHCSVQVGSAPVTFTWLHNGQEVARGPLLELRDIDVGHSGTYQCVATNQLGQDRHRVFRALSPELVLAVTLQGNCNKVAAGVGGALLFLFLVMGVIVAWHRWHHLAARKNQERATPDPQDPPEEGQVLYTHVVVTKRAGVSPRATTLQDPQVTYAMLQGHQGRQREPGDIYGNVL